MFIPRLEGPILILMFSFPFAFYCFFYIDYITRRIGNAVAGSSSGIKIPAVFVSKTSGETLAAYAGDPNVEIWIIPSIENSAWSIMAISFISLLAMSAVLATCFFVRRHRIRRERPRTTRVREFHGMSSRLVKAMPSLIFTAVVEDNCTSVTCAICLEDYSVGDKLRVLPCRHSKSSLSLRELCLLPSYMNIMESPTLIYTRVRFP